MDLEKSPLRPGTSMSEPPMFQERYQHKVGVSPEDFVAHLLPRTLYWHARVFRRLLPQSVFTIDRSFLDSVGRCRTLRDFAVECRDFSVDLKHEPVWKRLLYLRVSVGRLRDIGGRVW
jgi:hypothetical protein